MVGVVVAGENLVDLIVDGHGVAAVAGGGPMTTARTLARLGVPTTFLTGISADPFGRRIRHLLASDGVGLAVAQPRPEPTTLAIVDVDERGDAQYSFHALGSAGLSISVEDLTRSLTPLPDALHVGTLGLVFPPSALTLAALVPTLDAQVLVMADVNVRPSAIADRDDYLSRLGPLLGRANIVKVSVDDLGYLRPGADPVDAALQLGCPLVAVTDGARPVRLVGPWGVRTVDVPQVEVVDTVGAGDTFGAALLARLLAAGPAALSDVESVVRAAAAACEAAALSCTRAGAAPPTLAELATCAGWR